MSGPLRKIRREMERRVFGKIRKREKVLAEKLKVKEEGPRVEKRDAEG